MNSPNWEHIERLLLSYELGTLSESEEEEFELLLLEDPELFERVQELEKATHLMRTDPDVQELLTDVLHDLEDNGLVPSSRRSVWKRIWPAYVAAAAVFLLFLLVDWRVEFHPSSEAIAAENRLAVMYFKNLTGQSDARQWGEIATHLVVADLSESQFIQVVSEQRIDDLLASSQYATDNGSEKQAAIDVALASDVRWLIMGEVLESQPSFAISSQLIDMKSGSVVAAQLARGEPGEDIFSVVDQLTAEIRDDLTLPTWTRQEADPSVAEVTTSSPEAYRFYLAGKKLFNQFYFVESWENMRKAIELDSTFAIAHYYLHLLSDPGALETAVRHIERAGQRDQVYIRMGQAIEKADYRRAIAELERAIRRFPDYKEFYYKLGTYNRVIHEYEKSIQYYNKAIAMDPLYKDAYNGLAYVYMFSGRTDLSLQTVEELVAIAPDEANPWDSKGDIYAMLGRIDEAKAAFQKALAIKPDFYPSAFSLGQLYLREGDYDAAAQYFQSQTEQRNIFARSQLRTLESILMQTRGKYNQALKHLQKSITQDSLEFTSSGFPSFSTETRYKFLSQARIYTELGDRASANAAARQALSLLKPDAVHPGQIGFYLSVGQVFAVNGDSTTVRRLIEQSTAATDLQLICPEFARNLTGMLAYSTGNWETVITQLAPAVEKRPDPYSAVILAQAYIHEDKSGKAIPLLLQASENRSKEMRSKNCIYQPRMYFLLGTAYEQSGDPANARKCFERFLELWNDADPGLHDVEQAREYLSRAANTR